MKQMSSMLFTVILLCFEAAIASINQQKLRHQKRMTNSTLVVAVIMMFMLVTVTAFAAKVDPKPATLQSMGSGNTPPSSLKATNSTTPIEKNGTAAKW